jgi:hypothetical protein
METKLGFSAKKNEAKFQLGSGCQGLFFLGKKMVVLQLIVADDQSHPVSPMASSHVKRWLWAQFNHFPPVTFIFLNF